MILGIDEVGRGPWAGPLVMGACILHDEPREEWQELLTDSKQLTAKKREKLEPMILEGAAAWGLGWVSAAELDEVGMSKALRLACRRAVEEVRKRGVSFHEIIIDGTVNFLSETSLGPYVSTLKKADLLIKEVSAASIIAKVARDRYMAEASKEYPEYGFEKHVGYGTKLHREMLEMYGACPEHRRSFRPVAAVLSRNVPSRPSLRGSVTPDEPRRLVRSEKEGRLLASTTSGVVLRNATQNTVLETSHPHQEEGRLLASITSDMVLRNATQDAVLETSVQPASTTPMPTTAIGMKAEGVVAKHLAASGHQVLGRNYRTKRYEIDVISVKDEVIYFTEVKYRKDGEHGSPLEMIGREKLRQMKFAAEAFMHQNKLKLRPKLAVAAVVGSDYKLKEWFPLEAE